MKVSYNWLKEYIDLKGISAKKVADVLTMHAFEVEEVKKSGKDYILDIDILPNRAHDALSHIGIARELAALLDRKIKEPKVKLKEDKKLKIKDHISIDVKDSKLCRRYMARVILDVKVKDSPKWLREKMEKIGQKSINNIVDATNYVMFSLGQPLHAFDLDKIDGKKIIIKKSKDRDVIETLGGDKYTLTKDILTIADKSGALAIAGIKGGTKAEIDKNTKNIVLESANFDPVLIRKTSKSLGLRTDSSLRFENELSEVVAKDALYMVASLILDIAGGKLVGGVFDTNKNVSYKKRTLSFKKEDIGGILGVDIPEKEIVKILKSLGFSLKKNKDGIFLVEVPFERLDISLKEDIAEEVARVYGYENIKARPILDELWPAKRNNNYFFSEKAKDILVGLGFSDVYNYSFVSEKDLNIFTKNKNQPKLINPLSEDKKYLRDTLLICLVDDLVENLKYQKYARFFELGNVFFKDKKEGVSERKMLSGVISEKRKESKDALEFYEAKGVLDVFFKKMGVSDFYFDTDRENFYNLDLNIFHKGRFANIKFENEIVGVLGELSMRFSNEKGLKFRSVAFELDFKKIVNILSEEFIYKPISKYPSIIRDIAILTKKDTKVATVQSVIENAGGVLLSDVELFDIYENENTDAVLSKSLAFHLVFQAEDRTLKDDEVDKKMEKILKAVKDNNWDVKS